MATASTFAALYRGYAHVIAALAATMMGIVVVVMSVQVFCRYFLGDPLIWAEELCRYLLIWITFLSAGVAYQRGDIAVVQMLTAAMSPRVRALVVAPAYLATAFFTALLVGHGWVYAEQNLIQDIPAIDYLAEHLLGHKTDISVFWVYIALPIGFFLLALHFVFAACHVFADAFRRVPSREPVG